MKRTMVLFTDEQNAVLQGICKDMWMDKSSIIRLALDHLCYGDQQIMAENVRQYIRNNYKGGNNE